MPAKKSSVIVTVIIILAVLADGAYLARPYWARFLPSLPKKEAGGFKVIEKGGVKYKVCYTCPMHKQVLVAYPGDCPICGMTLEKKLVPLAAEGAAPKPAPKMNEMSGMAGTGELRRISLDPRQRMLANVATTMAMYRSLSQDVYTVGRISYNEEAIRSVTAWFPGRVERLYINFTGETVRKGARVMAIYSPDLIQAEKDYLIAKDSAKRLGASDFPEIASGAAGMLDAAKTRLKLWGITDAQVADLDKTGRIKTTMNVYSPVSGTVTEVMARPGDYLSEGSMLYKVVDLGTVWMKAEVYEYEFSKVALGSRVEVTADAYPGRTFVGRVSFIDPSVNPESRTVGVRAEFRNPGGRLKPEMFVNARIYSRPLRALTVPASAVLYTGTRNVAWVEVAPGVFEYRELKLGVRSDDEYQVLGGLREHEMVVTQGGFLIDSEAQLRSSAGGGMAGMPGMETGGKETSGKTAAPPKAPAGGKGGMAGMPGM